MNNIPYSIRSTDRCKKHAWTWKATQFGHGSQGTQDFWECSKCGDKLTYEKSVSGKSRKQEILDEITKLTNELGEIAS